MKALFPRSERKSKTSVAISFAAHVVIVAGIAAITFHYPLEELFEKQPPISEVHVRYVRLAPEPPRGAGGTGVTAPTARRATTTTSPLAPSNIPIGIPKPASPTPIVGTGPNSPGRVSGPPSLGNGVQPGVPDGRIPTNPMAAGRLPKTDAQRADSALSAIYGIYLDSVRFAQAHMGRAPGDWTWGGKNGEPKWGWDPDGIHIGGITIPNAVLAALPLNIGPTGNMNALTDMRNENYMRADIQAHANQMSEDEFRTAVQRIRNRVDKERQERLAARRRDTLPK